MKSINIPCGRFNFDQHTKKVTPNKFKGNLTVTLDDQNQIFMQWTNLDQNTVEIERYLFNNDAKLEKVKGQRRVYLLKFQSDEEKYFFWFQDDDNSKDDEYCNSFNKLLAEQDVNDQMIQEVPQPQQQQQQQQQQTQPLQPQQQPISNANMDPQNLQNMLMQMLQQQKKAQISLLDVLPMDFLKSIVKDEDYLNALLLHLPDGQQDPDLLEENLTSPQFQQALDSLTHALRNQERRGVLQQLELDPTVLETEYDGVLAFLKAIVKKVQEEDKMQEEQ